VHGYLLVYGVKDDSWNIRSRNNFLDTCKVFDQVHAGEGVCVDETHSGRWPSADRGARICRQAELRENTNLQKRQKHCAIYRCATNRLGVHHFVAVPRFFFFPFHLF
jgi:hypothetical protein